MRKAKSFSFAPIRRRRDLMTTILIVDDDRDVIELLSYLTQKQGFRLVTAEDGREGVELAQREKPSLVIMDIMMPKLDGLKATLELRCQDSTRDIPIIILTANGKMRADFEPLPNVLAYIEKPFEPKALTDLINKHLSSKKN